MTDWANLRKLRRRLSVLDRCLVPLSPDEIDEAAQIVRAIQDTGWNLQLSQKLLSVIGLGGGWTGKTSPWVHKNVPAKRAHGPRRPNWAKLRYAALERSKGRCGCCGRSAADGIVLHVDHVKPKSLFPELAFDLANLQVLCVDCNLGKSNLWDTDWRPSTTTETPELSAVVTCSAYAEHGSSNA